jgi:hypothetical protein
MLAGHGLLRWPGGEERVHYRVTVRLDSVINTIHIAPPVPVILLRPSRHGGFFAHARGSTDCTERSTQWLFVARWPHRAKLRWTGLVGRYDPMASFEIPIASRLR